MEEANKFPGHFEISWLSFTTFLVEISTQVAGISINFLKFLSRTYWPLSFNKTFITTQGKAKAIHMWNSELICNSFLTQLKHSFGLCLETQVLKVYPDVFRNFGQGGYTIFSCKL
jgi:hypothetical protein